VKIESVFDIGDTCWCTNGNGNGDIRNLTIGLIRVEKKDSPGVEDSIFENYKAQNGYKEEYMCVETGIGSGNVYTLGRNIFINEEEAIEAVKTYNNSLDSDGKKLPQVS
jgi:hypothetical protein